MTTEQLHNIAAFATRLAANPTGHSLNELRRQVGNEIDAHLLDDSDVAYYQALAAIRDSIMDRQGISA